MNEVEVRNLLKDLGKEMATIKDEAERTAKIAALTEMHRNYLGEDKVVSSHELLDAIKKRPEVIKINSGIKKLDDVLGGFVKKQLIALSGITKHGKTSFAIELTCQMKDRQPLFLPFEEPAEEIIQKFLDRGEEVPLFFTPEKMVRNTKSCLEWIEKKIIESKAKYGTEVVFIDQLSFIVPFGVERYDLVIQEAMHQLKEIAKRWDVLIFILCHLKKIKIDVNPDLEDLKDSASIAQVADTVILLWRKTERVNGEVVIGNETTVSVQANRRTGKTGNIKLVFDKGRFYEPSPIHQTHDAELESWTDFE
jgi:replicative DNA helicase